MLIRVFPRRTALTPSDSFAFIGEPPLGFLRPDPECVEEIHISVAFTWDVDEGNRLADSWSKQYPSARVLIGGPAFNSKPGVFTPGLYIKAGITFTTRGCNNHCPWCFVPDREGRLVELDDFAPGNIIQDNNLLQANHDHILRVLDMLKKQQRAAVFSGGLQASLIDDWFAEELRGLRIGAVFMAADTANALKPLEKTIRRLSFLPRRKIRVYVMIGYNGETIAQATDRLEAVWAMGGLPFAQLYKPSDCKVDYDLSWMRLARTWSRPAAMFAMHR